MATETPEQYKARIMAHVEGRDPVAVLRETPQTLAALVEAVPAEKLREQPVSGKWSVNTILAHLAEAEVASSWRYRQILENSGVALAPFDQDEWKRLGDYDRWEPREALEMFRLLRQANLRLFDKLTPAEWERFGMHQERGRMTVRDLASQIAGHDLNHLEQVRELLRKPESSI